MKQIAKYTAVILATLAILLISWQFKLVLLLFVLSLFVAAAIQPLVVALMKRGIPQVVALLLLYGVGVGSFVLVWLLMGDLLGQEINVAANQLVLEYEAQHRQWQTGEGWQQTAVSFLPEPFTVTGAPETELEQMAPVLMVWTQAVLGVLGGFVLLLVLSIYWSVDQHRFERVWLSLLPAKKRGYARDSWREVEMGVGAYLRSQFVQSLLAFLFLAVGAKLIGFDFPLLLAFVGAVAAFVPLFGGLLTAVFVLILASVQGWSVGVITAVYTLIVFIGLEIVVEPRLWPRKRRSFLLTILVILPLFEMFGLWGLIVAPALASAIEALIGQVYQAYVHQRKTAVALDDLEIRCQQLAQKIADAQASAPSPELQNLGQRLNRLLAESQEIGRE
ncbi:MAG: AI-2E family transporter [Chloroflexi bacterium]|nr:AI-2E family transporter [Chloroflexota bacterium]